MYFAPDVAGPDADRWKLNFFQWMLGFRVPGAAETAVAVQPSPSSTTPTNPQDRILLKNGDTISGTLLTEAFTVETSYAKLTFKLSEVASIILEGAGQNVELLVLANGDKLSGQIQPQTIKVRLAGGQDSVIQKDKIKEIQVQRRE